MHKSFTLGLAAATALVAGTTAYAQAEPRAELRGEMTRADVEQHTSEMFSRMDANDDGLLNDADRQAARREAFDSIDSDKDGAISFAEFEARRGERGEARDERAGRDGPEFAGPGGPRFGGPGMRGDRGLARDADADKDGAVTQSEFTTAALTRFEQADANGDGTISLEERREARQHMRHNMRHARPARDAG
jgi:Ca2+-binding EF-hand superfamily protein